MFRASKSVVGLDIGSYSIKAVELTKSKRGLEVTGFGRIDLGSESNRPEAIEELFRQANFQTKSVVTAVSGKSVFFRFADDLAKSTPEELRNTLRFVAERYFPFDITEMELDCQVLGDGPAPREGGVAAMKALLVGVKRTLVEDQAQMLLDIGLHPRIVDVDAFAIGNAFELNESLRPTVEPGKAIALLDLGANKTSINILSGAKSEFAREIYLGGNDFTNAIARGLGVETGEAESMKRNPADVEKILRAIAPVLDELANEVKLSLDYFEHQNDLPVEQVFLCGGGAMASYLESAIERAVERKSQAWNPLGGLSVDADRVDSETLRGMAPTLAVAVGLASRVAGKEV